MHVLSLRGRAAALLRRRGWTGGRVDVFAHNYFIFTSNCYCPTTEHVHEVGRYVRKGRQKETACRARGRKGRDTRVDPFTRMTRQREIPKRIHDERTHTCCCGSQERDGHVAGPRICIMDREIPPRISKLRHGYKASGYDTRLEGEELALNIVRCHSCDSGGAFHWHELLGTKVCM